MDGKSKKSSLTSGSVYASAEDEIEIEMADLKQSNHSDLNKFIKNSESHPEGILESENEDNESKEVDTGFGKEEEKDIGPVEQEEEEEEQSEDKPLLEETTPLTGVQPDTEVDASSNENLTDEEDLEVQRELLAQNTEEVPTNTLRSRLEGLSSEMKEKLMIAAFVGIAIPIFILTAIVLSNCFLSLYYDEYALARSTLTNKVDDKTVYGPGWHFVSPFTEWIKFYKTVHTINFKGLEISTTDQLKVTASFAIYYFLDKEKIGKIYRTHDIHYGQVIYRICKSSLINHAQEFAIKDFRSRRMEIKTYLKEKIKLRLKEEGINLFNIYMEEISFDKLINEINLKSIMNKIYNEKAEAEKTTALIHKQTEVEVTVYKNKARAAYGIAKQNGTYGTLQPEKTNYERTVELVHIKGLKESMDGLGFSSLKEKISFCWYNSLVYNDKIKYWHPNDFNKVDSPLSPYNNHMSINIKI